MTPTTQMNVRPVLEEGLRALFAAQLINAFTRQNAPENFQTVRPRTEIRCKVGAATGHRFVNVVAPGQTQLLDDTWFFEMALRCVVQPANIEADDLTFNQYVALIRGMALTFGQATWVDTINFPNCLIVEALKETTTDDTLQADNNEEFSILTFSGIVQIRTAAWNN